MHKITITFLATFALLFFSTSAITSENDLDQLLDEVKQKSMQLNSLTADFTQEKRLVLFQNPITFTGKIALVRPNRLRWEFLHPVPSVLIFNEKSGLRCVKGSDPQKFDLATDPVMKMVAEQLWTWLDGDYNKLKGDYSLQLVKEATIEIRPKNQNMQEIIEKITLQFEQHSKQPENIQILEPGGDVTSILFSNHILSPDLPESVFSRCYQ